MSLYNALFGVSPFAKILVVLLGIDNNEYPIGRFRDIYVKMDDDGKYIIILYTRNGGGNREEYQHIFDTLKEHPCYIRDYDDDFDCTYASVEFSVPDGKLEIIEHIHLATKERIDPQKAFSTLIPKLQDPKHQNDPDVINALNVGKNIFALIEEQTKKNRSGTTEV